MPAQQKPLLIPEREIAQMGSDFAGAYDPVSIQLFFSVRALARRINDTASAWLRPFGLTATQYNYLAVLYANRETGLSPTKIGDEVHTVSGTVASMLKALERDKLVRRQKHASDGRSAVIRLTKRGERVFHEAATAHHAHVAAVVATLPTDEAQHLLSSVLRLGDAVEAHAARLR